MLQFAGFVGGVMGAMTDPIRLLLGIVLGFASRNWIWAFGLSVFLTLIVAMIVSSSPIFSGFSIYYFSVSFVSSVFLVGIGKFGRSIALSFNDEAAK